jgi:hypothetical protein
MNPDKLFDYLEGKLPAWERAQVEEQLASDPRLQQELAMARRIHSGAKNESREVLFDDPETTARGRKMALRVATAFVVLIALNVGIGLIVIARKEASNPNRKLLDAQMRDQLTKSLQHAANGALTPPPLDVNDITIPAAPGQLETIADKVIGTAQRLGGSATKELPDKHRLGVLVDLPANREPEFRAAIATFTGAAPSPSGAPPVADAAVVSKSFVVQIVEPASP